MLPENFNDNNVCIVGLGYVGLTLAVVMCEAGFRVHGVERDAQVATQIAAGQPHFMEYGLASRLARQVASGRLTASTAWPDPEHVSVYIVTVGTPLNSSGVVDLSSITDVSDTLAARIKPNDLIILRSTVKIGVTRGLVKERIEKSGRPFDIAFCPERTVEGRALEELRSLPQIVGGDRPEATNRAAQLYSFLTPTVVRVDSLEAAEMIKLVNNTQRDLLFAFANEIALVCEDVGVSAKEVITAGNMGYARSMVPLPGPVGGPCLSKDPYILAESTSSPTALAQLSLLSRKLNEGLPKAIIARLKTFLPGTAISRIAIFGLAFKGRPETSDLRGTLATQLIADLRSHFPAATIVGFDPAVAAGDMRTLGIEYTNSAIEAARGAQLAIFQNNNLRFQDIDFWALSSEMAVGGFIYDMWNQFDLESIYCQNDVRYLALGDAAAR
jgi:nucleotide sugar dehydrogenase